MELKTLKDYEEACRLLPKRELSPDLQARKDALDTELEILHKQLGYLTHDLDRMEVMGENAGVIYGKRNQINTVKTKIMVKEKAINTLYIAPFAEAVW